MKEKGAFVSFLFARGGFSFLSPEAALCAKIDAWVLGRGSPSGWKYYKEMNQMND